MFKYNFEKDINTISKNRLINSCINNNLSHRIKIFEYIRVLLNRSVSCFLILEYGSVFK